MTMKLPTRSRYAVMALADMAHCMTQGNQGPFTLREIGERQEISLSYLEQIFVDLRRAGLVESLRGVHGGYRLSGDVSSISIGDIIGAVDTPVNMTRCQSGCDKGCLRNNTRCLTHDLWDELGGYVRRFLYAVSLGDVVSDGKRPLYADVEVHK